MPLVFVECLSRQRHDPFEFGHVQRQTLAGGRREDEAVNGQRGVVGNQPPQRVFVDNAVAKWRHQRKPKAAEVRPQSETFGIGHLLRLLCKLREPETGHKKPHLAAGGIEISGAEDFIARADPKPPERRLFSTTRSCRDSGSCADDAGRPFHCQGESVSRKVPEQKPGSREAGKRILKKAGLVRARLEYWPRWADTITLQEG